MYNLTPSELLWNTVRNAEQATQSLAEGQGDGFIYGGGLQQMVNEQNAAAALKAYLNNQVALGNMSTGERDDALSGFSTHLPAVSVIPGTPEFISFEGSGSYSSESEGSQSGDPQTSDSGSEDSGADSRTGGGWDPSALGSGFNGQNAYGQGGSPVVLAHFVVGGNAPNNASASSRLSFATMIRAGWVLVRHPSLIGPILRVTPGVINHDPILKLYSTITVGRFLGLAGGVLTPSVEAAANSQTLEGLLEARNAALNSLNAAENVAAIQAQALDQAERELTQAGVQYAEGSAEVEIAAENYEAASDASDSANGAAELARINWENAHQALLNAGQ